MQRIKYPSKERTHTHIERERERERESIHLFVWAKYGLNVREITNFYSQKMGRKKVKIKGR